MVGVLRVAEILDIHLLKFARAEQKVFHGDLIAERFRTIQKNPDQFFWIVHGKNGWFGFFNNEIAKFMKVPVMLRLFMAAVACANTKTGYDAEDALLDKMREKYGMGKLNRVVTESEGGRV